MKITEGKNKIVWLGSDFKKHFSYEFNEKKTKLLTKTLGEQMNDTEIMKKFHPEPIGLGEMMNFLKTADHNGWYIFYVNDKDNVLWAVVAYWNSYYVGWSVFANSVENPDEWDAGRQVVSCRFSDSLESDTLTLRNLEKRIEVLEAVIKSHNL